MSDARRVGSVSWITPAGPISAALHADRTWTVAAAWLDEAGRAARAEHLRLDYLDAYSPSDGAYGGKILAGLASRTGGTYRLEPRPEPPPSADPRLALYLGLKGDLPGPPVIY